VKQGDIWTVSGFGDYAGQPRSVGLIQDEVFHASASITVCLLTTDPTKAPLFRLEIEPSERSGVKTLIRIMVDKRTTLSKTGTGLRVRRLHDAIVRLNQAHLAFLGLAMTPRSRFTA
jgi:mRNA interferase MazF